MRKHIFFFLILMAITAVTSDDSIDQIKCGGCPCGNPCPNFYWSPPPPPPVYYYQSPPPPPVYYYQSPPPPPVYYYQSPPPPPRKTRYTGGRNYYCPPPPPRANFMYITGPPGDLYPIDWTNAAASTARSFEAAMWAAGVVATLILFYCQF